MNCLILKAKTPNGLKTDIERRNLKKWMILALKLSFDSQTIGIGISLIDMINLKKKMGFTNR